jgi:hypothetical protein
MASRRFGVGLACVLIASCEEPTTAPAPTAWMVFDDTTEIFAAPFPSEHLRHDDGTVGLSGVAPGRTTIVRQIHEALAGATGFGTTSGVHVRFEEAIDPSTLPVGIVDDAEAIVQLVHVDAADPEHLGERAPIRVFFQADQGPFGTTNVLTALPVQGLPLRAGTLYALVVREGLETIDGLALGRPSAIDALARGEAPPGLEGPGLEAYRAAFDALDDVSIDPSGLRAITVFRTQDPTAILERAVSTTDRGLTPSVPFTSDEVFDDYCVFHTTIGMPVYQDGEPPYASEGGAWVFDAEGRLVLDHEEEANLVVTLPRRPMPANGFPISVVIRTGAGGDRPLVDRGPHAVAQGEPIAPGTGPARDFAQVGWAGLSVDGPHGGLRNVTMGDEQFLDFNIQNPTALRDNLRQSALELVLLARTLDRLRIDASACPGLEESEARFDTSRVVLLGHSMGASIAPIAAAFEPTFDALVLSGAGASWLENILHKESPIPTRPLAESLLNYGRAGLSLSEPDPVLNLLQWAGEEADAAVYAPHLVRDAPPGTARHLLVFQGIVDTYILPPIANPLTISLGIDLAGEALDRGEPRLDAYDSILEVLPLSGREALAYPVRENVRFESGADPITAAVVQHAEDGIEDGHEVMWQTEDARTQLRCFLASMAEGAPTIADPDDLPSACR